MSKALNVAIMAALAANATLAAEIVAAYGDGESAGAAAADTKPAATTTTTRGRGRPSAASKAAEAADAKLTNDEVAAIVTKVKDHPKGGLPMAKQLIADCGVKKIADIKDQATLQQLKDSAEEKLAELESDDDGEEL